MDESNPLDQFHLGAYGDRHEQEFWPLLSERFPSYEVLWQRLIVPLTRRIDPEHAGFANESIRLRLGIPLAYEHTSMCHYSVFYFLGRAVQRFSDGEVALEHLEDVLFLLDSVGDNFKHFLRAMNDLGADRGRKPFHVYQIAIQIPASMPDGDYPIVATVNGVQSPANFSLTVQ